MTTQQDSVDVERLRVAFECAQPYVTWFRDKHCKQGEASWRDADELDREIDAALSLPITQRDEQGGALTALKQIAAYPSSTRITSDMHCDRETMINIAREAIRRLSIEQGDQDGGAECPSCGSGVARESWSGRWVCQRCEWASEFPHKTPSALGDRDADPS